MRVENGQNLPSILIVGNFLSDVVGNRGVCEDLAPRLREAGYQVTTTSERMGRFERLADMLATCWRERRSYDVVQVDVYSGPSFFWAEAVCWMLRRLGKPYILTLHGGKLPEFAAQWPRRVRHLLRSAGLVTAPSRYLQERLRSFHPGIILLPNALSLGNYKYEARASARPNLIWLRAFHAVYNPSLAVEVVAALIRSYPETTLRMAGPDKRDGSLAQARERASELNLNGAIHFPGRIPKADIPELINSGDIFLNTTTADNTPVSVLEAMACGACVVSTNVGGLKYLLDDGSNALLVEPDDAAAMAAAVVRILENPELASRLSGNARRTCESFDWPAVLQKWRWAFQLINPRQGSPKPSPNGSPAPHQYNI